MKAKLVPVVLLLVASGAFAAGDHHHAHQHRPLHAGWLGESATGMTARAGAFFDAWSCGPYTSARSARISASMSGQFTFRLVVEQLATRP